MRGAAAPGGQRPPALAASGRAVARDLLPLPFVSAGGTAEEAFTWNDGRRVE